MSRTGIGSKPTKPLPARHEDAVRSRRAFIRLPLEYLPAYETWKRQQGGEKRRRRGITGRGDATCIIDNILQRLYQKWASLDDAKRSAIRPKFHDRKRYGKRWVILADGLGKAILLLCSPRVASIV